MFLNLCLDLFLVWCKCIQINTQCTIKGGDFKDTVSVEDNIDEILQLLNWQNYQGQNLQRQFEKLFNQTERKRDEKKDEILAQTIANQLQKRLDSKIENLELQLQKLLNQTERQRDENKDTIANQMSQLQNRLDSKIENLELQFQKQLIQTERQVKGETQGIADQILKLRNRLDIHDQSLQLQFQKLLNQTENQVRRCEIEDKVAAQGIADQILQLRNQTVQLLCQDLETQIERQDICGPITPMLRDCSDIRANGQRKSGVYKVYVKHHQKLYSAKAYCDMASTNGTSWLVFQRRKDGSVDFYQNWSEYETGFGDPNGEFWLGNEVLHHLTSKRNYKLRIELEDFEGNRRYADYARFSIGPPVDNYRLKISGHSGDAEDSFSHVDGRQFTTKDADNDAASDNCAKSRHGAWWYYHCSESNLNGKYHRGSYSGTVDGVFWEHWLGLFYSLKTTEMKIAPATGFA